MVWPGDDNGHGSGQNPRHQNAPQGQDGGQSGWRLPSAGAGGYSGSGGYGEPGRYDGPQPHSTGNHGSYSGPGSFGAPGSHGGPGNYGGLLRGAGHSSRSSGSVPDVPPSTWVVKSPDTVVGFEDPSGKPEVAGSGAAVYKQGYCKGHSGSRRAQASVSGYSSPDLAGDAKDAAQKWATYGYTPDEGGSAPTVTLTDTQAIKAGGVSAQEATATVTVHDGANPCSPPRGVVHAVAVPLKSGGVSVLVIIADQGVADAMPDADLQKIAASVRPTT